MNTLTTSPALEFWFDFASTYRYLSVMRGEELARKAVVRVIWRPFLLGPIFQDAGWGNSPFVVQADKGRYMWKDLARQANKYGLALHPPSVFPRVALRPLRVALLGAEQPWMGAFCRNVMLQNFVLDLDIKQPDQVRRALDGLTPAPDGVMAAARSDRNKLRLREQTSLAKARGVFGAPTFFADDELLWGDDRMDDAFACAAEQGREAAPQPIIGARA